MDEDINRESAIFTITQLMELIRRLPMKFFTDVENRAHILEAMQSELDELIILEEKEENEVGGNVVLEENDDKVDGAERIVKNA